MNEKTILLVEDNADDEALTIRALKKNNLANKIDVVRDGAEAIDYLFCKNKYKDRDMHMSPQLILLDLNLPKMNGIDVLKHIRDNDLLKHIPVVMLTTSEQEDDITKSYDNGVNSFIRKPVDFKEFTDVVNQLGVYWMAINKSPKI